jgi:hypothetical protein
MTSMANAYGNVTIDRRDKTYGYDPWYNEQDLEETQGDRGRYRR